MDIDIYLSGLLARCQMRGHKMAEITSIKIGLRRFVLFWYTTLGRVFWFFKTKYNYTRPKFPYFTVVSLYSYYQYIYWKTQFV